MANKLLYLPYKEKLYLSVFSEKMWNIWYCPKLATQNDKSCLRSFLNKRTSTIPLLDISRGIIPTVLKGADNFFGINYLQYTKHKTLISDKSRKQSLHMELHFIHELYWYLTSKMFSGSKSFFSSNHNKFIWNDGHPSLSQYFLGYPQMFYEKTKSTLSIFSFVSY